MSVRVSVAVALSGRQEVVDVELEDGATVRDAIAAAGMRERFPGLEPAGMRVGIWSRPCALDTRLREGDRVEIYRPLLLDAKAMRRARLKPSSTRSRSGR